MGEKQGENPEGKIKCGKNSIFMHRWLLPPLARCLYEECLKHPFGAMKQLQRFHPARGMKARNKNGSRFLFRPHRREAWSGEDPENKGKCRRERKIRPQKGKQEKSKARDG